MTLPIGQLAFPAAQNPSANANTLDDYEEGSWTPTVQFSGASVGITYGAATLGRYTKIGRLVTASGIVTLTSKGSSTGGAQIAGLPFTSLNDSIFSSCAVGYAANFSSVTGAVLAGILANSNKVTMYHSNNGAAVALTNSNFTATTTLYFTVSYDAA